MKLHYKRNPLRNLFFNLRVLVSCLIGVFVALLGSGASRRQTAQNDRSIPSQDAPGAQRPDVVQMIGPVTMNTDLRRLLMF